MPTVRNATVGALLGLLHDGPMSGWDLVDTAQRRIGEFWTVTQSQVYRELKRMADAGLVTAGEPGARDRTPHAITDSGRAAFAEWVTADPAREQIRIPLLLVVQFADHVPNGRLREVIDGERARHAERLARYQSAEEQLAAASGSGGHAALRFGIHYERAALAWFDELPAMLGLDDSP